MNKELKQRYASALNLKNTKQLSKKVKCSHCKKIKPINDTYPWSFSQCFPSVKKASHTGYRVVCNQCMRTLAIETQELYRVNNGLLKEGEGWLKKPATESTE